MKRLEKKALRKGGTRTQRALMSLFLLVFVLLPAIGATAAKYVGNESAHFGDESNVDFTMNSVFVVDSSDELFAAINQGYTYVQLDKKIENPLIITQKAENLNNDLILDLNGIEIQRNGYEPILNVGEGIRLTIVDSSEEQTGGLYNPIGSVFNINGGTLTVVTGFFESGPRYSEYYSYNNKILNNAATGTTKRTIVEADAQYVTYCEKNGTESVVKAPIIKSYPTTNGEITYNHGNLYFDEEISRGEVTISADSYCYYRTSEDTLIVASDTTMADWYYTYYVDKLNYNYVGTEKAADDDVKITIYGYDGVIDRASEKKDAADYYAAIQMSDGSLEVQSGAFYQYFGVDTTACVNAQGGTIEVHHALFSSRIPNATEYGVGKVYTKESDKDAFGGDYFNNFEWFNATSKGLAKGGESYCILNGGSATVNVANGSFYSSNNSTISMQGGTLSVAGGSFTKSITNSSKATAATMLAAIDMKSGKLSVENSSFDISGDFTYGIYSTVTGNDNFNVHDTTFSIKGNGATGIYALNGTVRVTAASSATISLSGDEAKGICVESGGSVISENYSYLLAGDKCYGIYSTSGAITMLGGKVVIPSDENCYGIYAASDDEIAINVADAVIAIGCTLDGGAPSFTESAKTGTVKASVAVFLSSQNANSSLNLSATNIYSCELGIVSNGGTINLYEAGIITTNRASAIAIRDGDVKLDEASDYTIVSANTTSTADQNSYVLTLPVKDGTTIEYVEYTNTDGIYVNGGSFTSKGELDITHTGLRNATTSSGYYNYSSLVVTSYAVRVLGGNVNIEKGTITALVGGGIYAGRSDDGSNVGSVVLGSAASSAAMLTRDTARRDIVRVYTTGKLVGDEYNALGNVSAGSWQSRKSITGGHAVELDGGSITIYNGIFEAQFGNGIFVNGTDDANEENGTITVYNGLYYGYMNAANEYGTTINLAEKSGPSAFYGLKVVGGAIVNIYDGYFDGGNGGAFVTGVTKINNQKISASKTAYVYIYKGSFGSASGNLDAFNIYDDVNVVFGAYTESELGEAFKTSDDIREAIKLNSTKTSIAINAITYNYSSTQASTVYIYYGTYNGQMYRDPWVNSGTACYTYNVGTNADKYTVCTSTVLGDQSNSDAVWFDGKKGE